MEEDQKHFGQKSFETSASARLHRVLEDLCLEKLQFLQNTKKYYENQRDKIKQEVTILLEFGFSSLVLIEIIL